MFSRINLSDHLNEVARHQNACSFESLQYSYKTHLATMSLTCSTISKSHIPYATNCIDLFGSNNMIIYFLTMHVFERATARFAGIY